MLWHPLWSDYLAINPLETPLPLKIPSAAKSFTSNREWQIAETWRCRMHALGVWLLCMCSPLPTALPHFAPLIFPKASTVTTKPFEVDAQAHTDLDSKILSIYDASTTHGMETSDPRLPKEATLADP